MNTSHKSWVLSAATWLHASQAWSQPVPPTGAPLPPVTTRGSTVAQPVRLWEQAAETQATPPDVREAVLQGLPRFLLSLDTKGAVRLGFNRVPLASELIVSRPIKNSVVMLSALKSYRQGESAPALLTPVRRLTFLLVLDGQVSSSMQGTQVAGRWKIVSLGDAPLARAIAVASAGAAALPLVGPVELVTIYGLNYQFLAVATAGAVFFVPLFEDRTHGFHVGTPLRLQDVFLRLRADARAHNGLPT